MVLEQVRNVKIYKLPLDELHNLAPVTSMGTAYSYRPTSAEFEIEQDFDATEHIVMEELGKDLIVGSEEDDLQLPILNDSRISMGKIQEAQRILQELGLPPAQQNEISALTLLGKPRFG